MKMRLIALLTLVLAVALASGGLAIAGPAIVTEVNVSDFDAGRQIELSTTQVLVLGLDSNLSTGYGWYVAEMNSKVLRQVNDFEFRSLGRTGGVGKQVFRFQGVAKGQTTLNLVYKRPWEDKVLKTFTLQVSPKGPMALAYKAPDNTTVVAQDKNLQASLTALPTSFNWCNVNGCTAVRDQGQCGSCWAFSTVGALESAIKIQTGVEKDLSEQYLVSCNSDGWGCNGGWWAHDYHQWKYITGETGPGAVYEADFPYQALDVPCNPPHTHNEKIASWAYVGSSSSVPTVDALKNAIYTYGPVSAAVYVGNAFQSYTSGIFTTKQRGSPNHAIVLTGWDDTYGYWNMRNSWGASWGESGYMRIKYGTSYVGYAATYVVFP